MLYEAAMTEPHPLGRPGSTTTIATIAHDVGVSVATVSKVLNGREDVSPGTRARVEASLDRHQYQRRNRRSSSGVRRIDLVFHEFDTGWAMEVLRGRPPCPPSARTTSTAACSPLGT
jgi:hypothetical protein